jgi:flagellar biosynthesis/type III secretory pathway ATPase
VSAPVSSQQLVRIEGRVRATRGLTVQAHVPGARRGDWVRIERPEQTALDAEVIAFDDDLVTLMPFGEARWCAGWAVPYAYRAAH